MRSRERETNVEKWVCYSELVDKKKEGPRRDVEKRWRSGTLALKLDYEEILNAWSDKGPLCIDGDPPQTVPDQLFQLHDKTPNYYSFHFQFGWFYLLGGWNGSGITYHLLHFNLDPSAVQQIAQLGPAMGNMGQCPNLPNIIFSLKVVVVTCKFVMDGAQGGEDESLKTKMGKTQREASVLDTRKKGKTGSSLSSKAQF
ncbi:uncharacterized protein Pyn_00802 [Prunus yedoensis var. nudiflora]|uniref:Uncharacterized protein n=1 Tax=Prunus yedoensis var. nudiflora TaxID=2094558 RepID=A0A314U6L3_PRUYE|nr:uncharacterized protein Pyn_00802 [Prunus yedoensis var. nudiflora]